MAACYKFPVVRFGLAVVISYYAQQLTTIRNKCKVYRNFPDIAYFYALNTEISLRIFSRYQKNELSNSH